MDSIGCSPRTKNCPHPGWSLARNLWFKGFRLGFNSDYMQESFIPTPSKKVWHVSCKQKIMKTQALRSQPATSLFGRLVGMFQNAVDNLIPYGFEDETGFHYDEPVRARHMVRFHNAPAPHHARDYRQRHPQVSFHSYRVITREVPYQ